jgi:O-antigen ligase
LIAFAGFAMFSALYALFYQSVNPTLIVGELRPAMYFAGCAIIAATIARRQQLTILLVGLFVIADLTAGAVILHQFARIAPSPVGVPLSGDWQINPFGIGGGFGSVRVVPPGHVLMYLMANVAFCLMLRPPKIRWSRTVLALHVAFLGLALVLTYTRAQWTASGIALLLICAFLPRTTRRSLGRLLLVLAPVLALSVWLVGSELVPLGGTGMAQALTSRVTSVFTVGDTLASASLEWRIFELDAATRSLFQHPFLGVGLGNDYRDITLLQGEASGWLWQLGGNSRLTRFIHDSYLYVAVKMGILALGAFIWFCVAFLVGGTRSYLRMPDSSEKLIVLAIVSSFAGLLEWVVFEAHLMHTPGMVTLGLMVGLVAVVGSRFRLDQNVGDKHQPTRPAESVG